MKCTKPPVVITDHISAAFKITALKAAEEMPADGTLEVKSKYVGEKMKAMHPEVAWGLALAKRTPGINSTTSYM